MKSCSKAFFRFATLLTLTLALGACAIVQVPLSLGRAEDMRQFTVRPAEGFFVRDKILLVDISGVISAEPGGGLFGEETSMLNDIEVALDMARKDSSIKAMILRINSPGGEVTASDLIFKRILDFKRERAQSGKPIVMLASILGEGASGGYYIALAADQIYCHPTSITGSIGVISRFPDLSGLTQKLGVQMRIIKSADKKDIGSIWREFAPEERAILQTTVDELYQRFVTVVDENRPGLDRDAVLKLADGRVYTARQALDAKLIDGIAYIEEVVQKAKQQAGIKDAQIVTYRRQSKFSGGLYSRTPTFTRRAGPDISIIEINAGDILPLRKPGFYYLWLP